MDDPLIHKRLQDMTNEELERFQKLDPPSCFGGPDYARQMEGWRQSQWYARKLLKQRRGERDPEFDGHEASDWTCGDLR